MLETLRNKINSVFSKLFLFLLAASFALWGVGDIFSAKKDPTLAKVGHLEVTTNEFISTYQRILTELNNKTNGNINEETAKSIGVPKQTLNQLINEKIIDIEIEKANIILPDKHLKKLIFSSPLFKDQFGQFSQNQFNYVLRQLGMEEKDYFSEVRKSILRDQLRNTFKASQDISNIIDNTYYLIRNESRSIETINFLPSSFKSNIKPDTSAIKEELIKNINKYQLPEYRKFTIMSIKPADLMDSIKLNNEDIRKEYENNPEKFNQAETRDLYLANFNTQEKAEEIINLINDDAISSNDKKLKDIFLNIISKNTDNTEESLKLGYVSISDLPEEVANSVFSVSKSKLIGPEKTPFGWRIFYVNDIKPKIISSYEKIKDKIEKELKVSIALEKMYELGNTFYDELAAGNNIKEAASLINGKILEIDYIDIDGKNIENKIAENLPPYPDLIDTVFSTNLKETSEIKNTISNIMYAIEVEDIKPGRDMNFDEAKDKIVQNIIFEDQVNIAKSEANKFYNDYINNKNFKKLAKKYNLIVINSPNIKRDGSGSEGIINKIAAEQIFQLNKSEITKPIAYKNSFTISKLINITASNTADNRDKITEINYNIIDAINNDILDLYINNLTNKHNIKINNKLFESLFLNNS